MGFLVLLMIIILWLFIEKLFRQKLNIPKKSWRYKHERKGFVVLFYIIVIACIHFAFKYPYANFFLIFPFVGTLVNLIFSIEQFIYKKEARLYMVYILDAFAWFVLGVTANIFFS